ncbi:SKA complex subunit 1-like [Procambarus clarkii]|uniref:SKA complex subunit 1-like n=1 Tax=Procambarus clarkii TaxID=6728 RepID=UPI001E676415|nr:spindle and kinetochore-associated protein 1-like [Procambarus clarkii]
MSIVNTSTTLKSLDREFRDKIGALQICAELRGGWGEDTVLEIEQLSLEVKKMQEDVAMYRSIVATAKNNIQTAQGQIEQIQQLCARLTHMTDNLPSHVPHANARTSLQMSTSPNLTAKQANANKENVRLHGQGKVFTKVASGKTRQIPAIDYLTVEEFESVPKYIRGRLQYEQVNNAVNELNKTLDSKYTLLSRHRSKLSETDWRIVNICKRQETQETKGSYFVVDDDIKRWSGLKLDTAGRSMMTVLRTLKRIREVRGPGGLVRFTVIS